ncbi:MAG: tRNA/rRNA methyltransferase (SpoU) [Acidobacteriaceae bacterium]|nr:tRNA/rRNA methyltransferase (SpoU) [Acidobacteriaceae bacterium]
MTEKPNELAVVLVRTRNPLNIGAVARAMQNFGVCDLRVVQAYEASFREARSAVGAGRVLAEAREFATAAEAVADCRLVLGTTAARRRELQQRVLELEDAADEVHGALAQGSVALLFGSEKHGLRREDLESCHALLRIGTDAEQPSMNLGQAAAVCLWELTRPRGAEALGDAGRQRGKGVPGHGEAAFSEERPKALSGNLDRLGAMLLELLEAGGYTQPRTAASTEAEVRRLLRRLHVTDEDTHLLTGMVRKLLWRLGRSGSHETGPGGRSG